LSISLAALALSPLPATAADEATELEAVTISATRARSEAGKTPQKITVISREQIEQQLAITSDHGAILSNLIPSYSPSRQKMSSAGETFRGRSALILIDGVPQSTPLRDSQRDGYVIDLSMVERIEVIHGASAEHGLGATGGIINYVTRRPESGALRQHAGVSFTAPTDYESEGLGYKLDYRVEGTQGDLDYLAAASWQTQGMFYDANGDLIGVDDTQGDVMDSTGTDLLLKLGYWLDDNQNIGLMVNRYEVEGDHEYVNVPGDADAEIPATSRKGNPQGIAASESANNAVCGGAMVPMLTFGIPGDPITAIMLGVLVINGIQPGPQLMSDQAGLIAPMLAALLFSAVVLIPLTLYLIGPYFIKIVSIRKDVLYAVISLLAVVGSYVATYSTFQMFMALGMGVLAFYLRRNGLPVITMLLGYILGPNLEEFLRRSLALSNGNPMTFFTNLDSLFFIVLTMVFVYFLVIRKPAEKPVRIKGE
jgi:hypothetical protein